MLNDPTEVAGSSRSRVIAESREMREVLGLVERVAQSNVPAVLLEAESGVGTEVIASWLHQKSVHRPGRFVSLHCASLPGSLLAGELFGNSRPGLLELAEKGTVFLDDVNELPPELQEQLVDVLSERQFQRVGGTEDITCDVQVIAATHEDLACLVNAGMFRMDLYYRLSTIRITIPPLRERRDDIVPLAEYFLQQYAERMQRPLAQLTAAAKAVLERHSWPGNTRQLQHAMLRAAMFAQNGVIDTIHLPMEVVGDAISGAPALPGGSREAVAAGPPDNERRVLMIALAAAAGDVQRAAEIMSVSAEALRHLMEKHSIEEG
jgi:transcriptional regulator with PAS, ATPase and Fis domain